ncbi:MAG: hypothetical protein E4H26_08805 [Flavobacteriales bacterium]|nr:MAG: hypothetical protein E4H26_08805 [Flavobacteriales bacterium]
MISKVWGSFRGKPLTRFSYNVVEEVPLSEARHGYWNFVSSDPASIEKAKRAWVNKDFPMMANDNTQVPLPGS